MPDRPRGSLSMRMDTKNGSKKLSMTFQHFYRYFCRSLAQVGQQIEDGNLENSTAVWAGVLAPLFAAGDGLHRESTAPLPWPGDRTGDIRAGGQP